MRLIKARIQNYRSIVDSGKVNINAKATILIGKNEQGKTNFLKALKSFNSTEKYARKDLPKHLQPELDNKSGSEIEIVTLWHELDDADRNTFQDIIAKVKDVDQLMITRYHDGTYSFHSIFKDGKQEVLEIAKPDISQQIDKFKNIATEFKSNLLTHADRLTEFGKSREQFEKLIDDFIAANFFETSQIDNLLKTLSTAIKRKG